MASLEPFPRRAGFKVFVRQTSQKLKHHFWKNQHPFCPTFELCTPITRWVQWKELCAPQLSRATQEGWLRTSHPWHTPAQALPSPSSTLYTPHPLPRSLLRALAIAAPFPAPPDTHTSGSHFTPQLLLPPWPCLLHQPQDAQHGWQCHEAAARLQKGAVKPPRLCLGQKRSCQGPGNGRDGCRITQTTPEDK